MKTSPSHPTCKLDMMAIGFCLSALCFWTAGPLFITYLAGYLDGWTQNALRYTVAMLCWLPTLYLAIRRGRLDKMIWKRALVPSIPNILMQSFWVLCFYYAGPALIVLLTKTNVLWIAGFSLFLFPRERALVRSTRFWLGFILSCTGLVGVVWTRSDLNSSLTQIGIIIAMCAAFFSAIYTVSIRIAFRHVDVRLGFSVVSIYTVAAFWVTALLFGNIRACLTLTPLQWGALIVSGITAIALGHVSYYAAIQRLGATIPALVILVQPFTILVCSHFLFHEQITLQQILFGILLLIGAAFAILAQRDLAKTQESAP